MLSSDFFANLTKPQLSTVDNIIMVTELATTMQNASQKWHKNGCTVQDKRCMCNWSLLS